MNKRTDGGHPDMGKAPADGAPDAEPRYAEPDGGPDGAGRSPDFGSDRPLSATLTGTDGDWTLTLEKEFAHPAAKVWPWLTDPARLAQWSPAVPDRPLGLIGPASVRENPGDDPVDGEVLKADPPRELIHRWGESTLRWSLTDTAAGCRLRLEQDFGPREVGALAAAGWHICLAVLEERLADLTIPRVVGQDAITAGWPLLHTAYTSLFSPPPEHQLAEIAQMA